MQNPRSFFSRGPVAARFLSVALLLTLTGSAVGFPIAIAQEATSATTTQTVNLNPVASKDGALRLQLKQLGDEEGFELKTVRSHRTYYFTKPKHWKVAPSSSIVVVFQHSASLLPERSSLNVRLNNRILKTIPLGKDNVNKTAVRVPLDPKLLKEKNSLTFEVDQHYTYQCEDPFSTELWTTLLPETTLELNYNNQPIPAQLAAFPYPFIDELGYGKSVIGFSAPASLSAESMSALASVASTLGSTLAWRPSDTNLINGVSGEGSIVVVGTPAENSTIGSLNLPVKPSGSGFGSTPDGMTVGADDGLIQLIQKPGKPYQHILVVSGNSPEGVKKAAQFLASNPARNLMAGQYVIVKEYSKESRDIYRGWKGWVTEPGMTLAALGLDTQTSRGVTALPIYYNLKRMPDLAMSPGGKVKIRTHYSYASQLEPSQSKLEVRLNGKSLGSKALDKLEGETNAVFELEIPVEDFFTYNDLEYQFFLYPPKMDLCKFVTDAHIWGTVHNTTAVDFQSEVRTALPDAGLVNDGGFPFTEVADFSEVAVVMPTSPTQADQNTLLQLMMRLGKESPYSFSKLPLVVKADNIGSVKGRHLIVIGQGAVSALKGDLKSKYQLVIEGKTANLSESEKALATISHDPNQGVLEELISPYNDNRVVLLAYGETETGQQNIAELFADDKRFKAIGEGNISVVNSSGTVQSVTAMKRGDARLIYDRDKNNMQVPAWLVFTLGFLGVVGLFALIGAMFSGRKRR